LDSLDSGVCPLRRLCLCFNVVLVVLGPFGVFATIVGIRVAICFMIPSFLIANDQRRLVGNSLCNQMEVSVLLADQKFITIP